MPWWRTEPAPVLAGGGGAGLERAVERSLLLGKLEELVVFVAVLLAALAYLWRCGALDFAPPPTSAGRRRGR